MWGQPQGKGGGKDWSQGGGGGGGGKDWGKGGGGGGKGGCGGKDWSQGGGGGGKDWNQGGGGGKDWNQGGGGGKDWNQSGGGGGGGGKDWNQGGQDWGKSGGKGQDWGSSGKGKSGGGSDFGKSGGGKDWGKKGGGGGGGGKDWGKKGGATGGGATGGGTPGEVGPASSIRITGCTHDTVGPIIRGEYQRSGENHGKPAYKKGAAGPDGLTVMIYFWDERDGPAASGWWIGPSIGGNMVWGHHSNRTATTPPASGWQAPHSSPEDNTLVIAAVGGGAGSAGASSGAAAGGWSSSGGATQWGGAGGGWSSGGDSSWEQQQAAQQAAQQAKKAEQEAKLAAQRQAAEEAKQAKLAAQREAAEKAKAAAAKAAEEKKVRMAEQAAAATLRREILKLKAALPDTFEALKTGLAKTLAAETPKLGSMAAALQAEHDKALAAAEDKVDKLVEAKKKAEAQKKALEEKQAAARAKAKELLGELKGLADTAEEASKELTDELKALGEQSLPTEIRVETACSSLESTREDASTKVQAALEFIKAHSQEIRAAPSGAPPKKGPIVKPGESAEEGPSLAELTRKINVAKAAVDRDGNNLKAQKKQLLSKAGALEKIKAWSGVFTKYDKDKDGMLNKKEITALAKGEYSFTVPEERLQTILKVMSSAGKGVKADDFRRLLAVIGLAREQSIDVGKKAAREAREAELTEAKKAQQELIDAVQADIKEAQAAVQGLQTKAQAWPRESRTMKSQEMLAKVEELEAVAAEADAKLKGAQGKAAEYGQGEVDKDLVNWVKNQKNAMEKSAKMQEANLTRSRTSIKTFKDQATKKNDAEVKVFGQKALTRLHAYLKEKSIGQADLFKELSSGAEGIGQSAFVAFIAKLPKAEGEKADEEFSEEDIGRGFGLLDEEKAGTVSAESFGALLRTTMRVIKDVALTPDRAIADTKVIRRLELGEAVEVLQGPVEEEGLERVRVRCVLDEKEGWVSLKGNQGTKFLAPGGNTFKVLKETILTEEFDITAPPSEASKVHPKTRKLKPGEIVEVRQWGRKHEETGLTRMKCKAQSDGLIGWVTTLGNTGVKFVEML